MAALRRPPHTSSVDGLTPFSLFDGDLLNRFFKWQGLGSRHAWHLAGRAAYVVCATWVIMAVLALAQGLYSTRIEAGNFFADYAAYGQFLIALPLFIVAERIVSRGTREAAEEFVASGVVAPDDIAHVEASHRDVERLRLALGPELICMALAYTLMGFTLWPEFHGGTLTTWHSRNGALTWAGFWLGLIALPTLNYWWLRLIWKIWIWTTYLYQMSRLHLHLVATHPDKTGGLGFISQVQSKFALVIFAYGISNVAAVIAYKIAIEHASPRLMPVWGPAVGFIFGAPLLFTLPLLMFTKQLFRTKRRALILYRERARHQAITFEETWLRGESSDIDPSALNNVATMFERVEGMRVVPFDLWSATQLIGSTLGSIASALPLLKLEASLKDWLEFLAKVMHVGI